MSGGESSSTSNTLRSTPPWKYDVFLSFAGQDTRLNFTDHLYEAFKRSGIKTFRDDVDLERGRNIMKNLSQAIEDSLCAVVVISKSYANSKWCLNELEKILESKMKLNKLEKILESQKKLNDLEKTLESQKTLNELEKILESQRTLHRRVFPIFYNVDPADVRKQTKSFMKAFANHEKKFRKNPTIVQNWRNALIDIGNIAGVDTRGKHEAYLIKNIVGDVWSFLSTKLPSLVDNLVGIDSKVADVIPFLEIGLDDKRFVGIWGMGGVGKTTLARVVSEKLSDKFEICCFLEMDKVALPKDLVSMQKSLLSRLQIKDLEIFDSYEGMQMIQNLLCKKKVLIVLDGVDHMSQLQALAESPDWFGEGSRIIITTRDSHLLTSFGVERIYKMETMNDDESLQIFSKKAFNKNQPEQIYLEYSKSVVKCVGGLPLALQALGSYLCGRREEAVWRDALNKLKQINPYKNILQVLKLSYDGLDEKEQTIFLDIVCLFKHWKKEEVTKILRGCDLNPILGIKVLIEKTLLVETDCGKLDMHDLYEDLGWYIIQQKPTKSRLRKFGEIKEVLENNKGSGEIEAIVMEEYGTNDKIEVHPEAFSNMSKLRLLLFNCPPDVPTGLKKLSGTLKFVRWPLCPLEALPLPLDELVHIEMLHSNIKQLWNGIKSMNHLKFINLSGSPNFTETPDFSNVQSLEHLRLSWCKSLVKVHESLGVLKELVEVDLRGCKNLNSLPSKLETNSLRRLDLRGCETVKELPSFGKGMQKLLYLDASHTAITRLPESFGSLTGLRLLNLSATGLINLPTDCFFGLFGLAFLLLVGCKRLVSLPRLPPRLIRLEADGCHSMKSSLDEQLLTLVTSLDHEWRGKTECVISDEEEENMPFPYPNNHYSYFRLKDVEPEYHPLRNFRAIMPSGGKIPSWFDPNIKYYGGEGCGYYDEGIYECEIEVDIPPNFRASKWSGIVVCLYIKGYIGGISWRSKAPEDEEYKGPLGNGIGRLYGGDGLCVMVVEFNQKTCWQHLRGDNNSLHIQLSSAYIQLRDDLEMWGYGWRVICKEDIQKWCNPNHFNQFTQPQHALPFEVKLPLGLLRRLRI